MEASELVELYAAREEAIRNSNKDPFRYGFKFKHWQKVWDELVVRDEALVLGGNRCLAPEQEIYDPVADVTKRISEITEAFHIFAWDGKKRKVCRAEKPFVKDHSWTYRVVLSNGQQLLCSALHEVSTPFGWRNVSEIGIGGVLSNADFPQEYCDSEYGFSAQQQFSPFLPSSNSGRFPSRLRLGVLSYLQKLLDSLDDCHSSPRFYDGRLPSLLKISQEHFPLQDDVPEHTSCVFSRLGGLVSKFLRNHPYSKRDHLSNPCEVIHFEVHSLASVSHTFYKVLKPQRLTILSRILQKLNRKFLAVFSLLKSIPLVHGAAQYLLNVFLSCLTKDNELRIVKAYDKQVEDIWDITVPETGNYFIGNTLQKNSSKTQFGAYSVVKAAMENPASIIMCFAQSSEVSIRQQQSAVYNWLPPEYRMKQTSSNAYISYTLKNGFTDNSLILPNKSQILFKTYSQYQNNPTFIEGAELGSKSATWHNVGVWLDEYLLGEDLISTMRFRLATRNSKMLVTFTPIDGWTEVIKDYLDKAKTIETREAELLNGEILPYIQHSHKRNASIHYFHTIDNPFSGYERLANDLRNESREKILIRAYGVPVKSQATKFPKFNKEVNVVPHETIPTKGITRYHIIDPAGSKNWFMSWIAVDGSGTYYVYREWPDTTIGEWAEWKNGKWASGEGAKGLGYGMKDYVDLIHELEGDEEIYGRIIDPRLGAAKYQAQDGSSSIIEDLAENDIICIPAPGLDIEDGLQALISKMSWDTSKPMDSLNRPKFYVSEECGNVISALSEYTGEHGLKEAWKDPLDTLRYAAIYGIDHVEAGSFEVTMQGSGGY
jgi:hypothetical protein